LPFVNVNEGATPLGQRNDVGQATEYDVPLYVNITTNEPTEGELGAPEMVIVEIAELTATLNTDAAAKFSVKVPAEIAGALDVIVELPPPVEIGCPFAA